MWKAGFAGLCALGLWGCHQTLLTEELPTRPNPTAVVPLPGTTPITINPAYPHPRTGARAHAATQHSFTLSLTFSHASTCGLFLPPQGGWKPLCESNSRQLWWWSLHGEHSVVREFPSQ
jgi:hypothetical protein